MVTGARETLTGNGKRARGNFSTHGLLKHCTARFGTREYFNTYSSIQPRTQASARRVVRRRGRAREAGAFPRPPPLARSGSPRQSLDEDLLGVVRVGVPVAAGARLVLRVVVVVVVLVAVRVRVSLAGSLVPK